MRCSVHRPSWSRLRIGNSSKAAVLKVLLERRPQIEEQLLAAGKDCIEIL